MRVAGQSPPRVMSSEGSARRGAGRGAGRDGGRGGLRPGRGRGRGREAKGSRALPDRDAPDFSTRLSKRMSHLLRHGAVEAGLGDAMDASGYLLVRDVLALPRFAGITEADVRRLVASCPKRRFELRGPIGALAGASGTAPRRSTAEPASSSSLSIRATQGHSMSSANTKLEDDLMLTRLDERAAAFVAEAAHGTTTRAWAKIKKEGVKRARRRHVHMARATPHLGWFSEMTPNATETARECSIECDGRGDEGSSEPSGAATRRDERRKPTAKRSATSRAFARTRAWRFGWTSRAASARAFLSFSVRTASCCPRGRETRARSLRGCSSGRRT